MKNLESELFGHAFWLFLFSMIASVLNYAFQIMLGNMLTISEYGQFNVINSLASNMLTFFTPLSMMACRITAEQREKIDRNRAIYIQLLKAG